jgi:hypothetical protein
VLFPNAEKQPLSDPKSIDNAPEHVKLAIDLILLLEQHDIDVKTALQAIKIVEKDLVAKLTNSAD